MTSEWRDTKFEDVAELRKEKVKADAIDPDEPYIGLEHVEAETLRFAGQGRGDEAKSTKARFRSGDVLFGKLRPYFRKVVRPHFDGVCSTDIWVIRPKDGVDPGYLQYLVADQRFVDFVNSGATGTRMPRGNWKHAGTFPLQLPPLVEQQAVAEILVTLDEKVETNHIVAEMIKAVSTTVFRGLVQEHPDRGQWERVALAELMELDKGVSYKGDFLDDDGRPMVNLGCFRGDGNADWSKVKGYSGDTRPRHEVDPGSLVIANTDMTQKRVVLGSVTIVPPWLEDAIISHHVYAVRWKDIDRDLTRVVYFELLEDEFRRRARGFATGTTVLGLPRDAVLDHEIVIPPRELLERANRFWSTSFEFVWHLEQQNDRLTRLRDTLLPKLVSGELRVPDPGRLLEAVA